MSRGEDLTKNTLIITVGRISTQFITFLLLPLYTTFLTTEEYGTVDLISTLVQLFIPIVSIMIDQGVFRHLLNCKTEYERKETISSAFFLLLITSTITVFLYTGISLFVTNEYKLWMLLILVVTAFSNFFLQIARGLKHTSDYAYGSFVCSASTIVLNVLCIAFLHMGAVGMLAAIFAGNIICCIFLFFRLKIGQYIGTSAFDKKIAKDELKYSFPLVPNQLSLWVMNSSDRLIVTFFLGVSANGILAVSHKFPAIYLTFFNIFLLAWHETGAVHYFDKDRDAFFTDAFKKILSLFSTLCLGIIALLPFVFDWFVDSSYKEAYFNIPIYLVASLFNVIVGLLGVVYVATKKTGEIAKTTLLAAAINIVVHLALIKTIGLYAASVSTFVGYGITMICRIHDAKRYLNIKYDKKQFACIGFFLVIYTVVYYLDNIIISLLFLPFLTVAVFFLNRDIIKRAIQFIDQKIEGRINKKLLISTIVAISIIMGGLYVFKNTKATSKMIQTEYRQEIIDVVAENVILFSDINVEDFTCTGMAYDSTDDAFWIGDFGAMNPENKTEPRIVEVNRSIDSVIREIDLDNVLDASADLQGVTYDSDLDCLWVAVGDTVCALNKDGEILKTIQLGKYTKYKANGICYDESDDSLWVLCASKYLLNIKKDGTVMKEYSFNYFGQDHICINGDYLYITVGADYQGINNYVCKVSTIDGDIKALYRVKGANALEGICLVGGKMMIVNDGLYHSDLVGKSYISIFDSSSIEQFDY